MKQIISVRSNSFYEESNQNGFHLRPSLELVIIHTDGKDYKMTKTDIAGTHKLNEIRLIVSPELMQGLITDLQLHQKKLENLRHNADQLNSLIKHITGQ